MSERKNGPQEIHRHLRNFTRRLYGKAVCRICGEEIEEWEDRIVLVVAEIAEAENEGFTSVPAGEIGSLDYICVNCLPREAEFHVPNPWLRQLRNRTLRIATAEEQRVPHNMPKSPGVEITRGPEFERFQSEFNSKFSHLPSREDAMGHAISASRMARRLNDREDDGEKDRTAELEELILSSANTEKVGQPVQAVSSPISAVERQKSKLARFLNTAASKKLRPHVREAAQLWVSGRTQAEIATKLGVDQSVVSRILKAAAKQADLTH